MAMPLRGPGDPDPMNWNDDPAMAPSRAEAAMPPRQALAILLTIVGIIGCTTAGAMLAGLTGAILVFSVLALLLGVLLGFS